MIKIFVLTLKESTDRQKFMEEQFNEHSIPFEFIYAINGKLLSENEKSKLYDHQKAKKLNRELNPGEIGCSLSHKKIYEKIINESIQKAIVMEDDVTMRPDFYSLLDYFNSVDLKNTVIKLERCYGKKIDDNNEKCARFTLWHRRKIDNKYFIGQPLNDPYLTWAYYIDFTAACILYSLLPKVFLYADSWWYFRKYIKLRMINQAIVNDNEDIFNSLIVDNDIILLDNQKKDKLFITKDIKKIFKYFFLIFH